MKEDTQETPAAAAATPSSAEAPQPPVEAVSSFSSDDDGVTVVQDAEDYLRNLCAKSEGTQWVRGLSPEDEETNEPAELEPLSSAMRGQWREAEPNGFQSERKCQWFRDPFIAIGLYIVALIVHAPSAPGPMRLDFPCNAAELNLSGRRLGETPFSFGTRVGLPLVLPSGVAAVGSGWLCFVVGSTVHRFLALCGVGVALLHGLAVSAQLVALNGFCGISDISNRWECDIPFVLHWVCSTIRVGSPFLSLWCATPVLDTVRSSHWRCATALPVAVFLVAVGWSAYREERATWLLELVYNITIPIYALFIGRLWKQPLVELVEDGEQELHED